MILIVESKFNFYKVLIKFRIQNFTKIRPVESELLQAGGRSYIINRHSFDPSISQIQVHSVSALIINFLGFF